MAQASAEKLEHTGPAEKERVASVPQRAVGKYARAALAKRKRNRAVSPEYQIVSGERGGSEREHEEERVDSTVNEGRFRGGEGGQARRASLGDVKESMSG